MEDDGICEEGICVDKELSPENSTCLNDKVIRGTASEVTADVYYDVGLQLLESYCNIDGGRTSSRRIVPRKAVKLVHRQQLDCQPSVDDEGF